MSIDNVKVCLTCKHCVRAPYSIHGARYVGYRCEENDISLHFADVIEHCCSRWTQKKQEKA